MYSISMMGNMISIDGVQYSKEEVERMIYLYRAALVAGECEENRHFEDFIEYWDACHCEGQ